jgi:hypothetical protein
VASQQDDQMLRAVSLGGRQRQVARLPADLAVLDVDPQGRLLLERRLRRTSVVALLPGETRERDLSLLDTTEVVDLSADSRLLVLGEEGSSPGTDVTYLRKTDGSPAVRLGDDMALSLSPDGRSVLAFPGYQMVRDHLILVPTGAGARRELRDPSIREFAEVAAWFPDGRRIACVGAPTGKKAMRVFVWDIESGAPPRPLSPEGSEGGPVSPDGRWVAGHDASGGLVLYAVDGAPARRLGGGAASDMLMRWSGDGRWIYVRTGHRWHHSEAQASIERIEVATGKREPWKVLMPPDPAGVHSIGSVQVTPDGKGYAYSVRASIGSLYLAEGLR